MSGTGSGESTGIKRIPAGMDPKIRAILACPKCHGDLNDCWEPEGFACGACGLLYAVEDGIANFIIDEARPWPGKK